MKSKFLQLTFVIGLLVYFIPGISASAFATGLIPTVTTISVTNTGDTTKCLGEVTNDQGFFVSARGFVWSTDHKPTITENLGITHNGTGMGSFPGVITGLAAGNVYYIRAYATNSEGTSYGAEREVSLGFICGSSTVTVNHTAGVVAPVSKTVIYSTVTNIPGEPAKCWITKNLGATTQAATLTDATEAAAGWYWQFGKKQGFKYDASRIPTTTWINSITTNSDWLEAQDPCKIEMGGQWRVPTASELTNIDSAGGWTSPNDPWNSGLKIHFAGRLLNTNGVIEYRGASGRLWSSTQSAGETANAVVFWTTENGNSYIDFVYNKAFGCNIRCIREWLPVVKTTTSVSSLGRFTAISGGNVTYGGESTVTERGVCYGTAASPSITNNHTSNGTGTGTFSSPIIGLSPGQTYFVRAYAINSQGIQYGNEVSFTTLLCDSTFTINHTTGAVAPVNKTVTYSTVTNIPGEPSKCWISKNLGATNLPTSVSDATEASAGWYWQFNRKQGYQYTTSRTPGSAWPTVTESSEWVSDNDPCTIELGGLWRIPTKAEWTNIDAGGAWTTWAGPWNSGLKLHGAGRLSNSGVIGYRGSAGRYWSSEQGPITANGYMYTFDNSNSELDPAFDKAYAGSIRCIRDWAAQVNTSPTTSIGRTTAVSGGDITAAGSFTVTGRGVCWSTESSPTIADAHIANGEGTGSYSVTITGLKGGETYFVRAYAISNAGTSYGNEVSFTTLICESSITINHQTSGGVAPVAKNLTYGIVEAVPGEPSKCWITKNLGATTQASSATDATESSSGWYWQFNRKQGYQYTTSRTPNSTWITAIPDPSDWALANDPCRIEMGTLWRIPTSAEWTNVDAGGAWDNHTETWNSVLKIHSAGYLTNTSPGTITSRGTLGDYWSSTQYTTNTSGNVLRISSSLSLRDDYNKAYGFPVRCIRGAWSPVVTTNAVTPTTISTATCGGTSTDEGGFAVTERGVCWGTTTMPTILGSHTSNGTGTGPFTSELTGLVKGKAYFVRAYITTIEGTAYGNEVSFINFLCESSITINHIAGGVAPVTKTVTYNTVSNIPGEIAKCWITKNLGATDQATSETDATEPSAGWYWQFGEKQGFKHDGTTRTPNSTWITSIDTNSNWTPAQDPCRIEMGGQWRLPTSSEWTNVDAGGAWDNLTEAWNSGLKLHAAGNLSSSAGGLAGRGTNGYYWSGTQNSTTLGWIWSFSSATSNLMAAEKVYGLPVRCVRDWSPDETSVNFKADTTCWTGPLTVHFTDLTVSDRQPLTWKWYFGDGTTSTLQNPQKNYPASLLGMHPYTVTLTVTDASGISITKVKEEFIKICPPNFKVGIQSGVWTKEASPYYIGGEIIVPTGTTLELRPGTILQFKPNATDPTEMDEPPTRANTDFGFMTVYGTLKAQGNATDSVIFTRMGTKGSWGLIHMRRNANPLKDTIKYCRIEHASYLHPYPANLGESKAGLCLDSNSTPISHNLIRRNFIGIQCDSSSATIKYNNISFNGSGILCNKAKPLITSNEISSNNSGIGFYDYSAPQVRQTIIASNKNEGIGVFSNSIITAVSNTIVKNGYGLYFLNAGAGTKKVDNSILWDNTSGNVNAAVPTITWSCVMGGYGAAADSNINVNPKFEGSSGNPYNLTWPNCPLKTDPLKSPCINTGNPNLNGTGSNWLTDPADRDPDMSRPDRGARYFYQAPHIYTYNIPSAGGDSAYYDFGQKQIPNASNPRSMIVRNNADRLVDCRAYISGINKSQFHLVTPGDSIFTLGAYGTKSVPVVFQPNDNGVGEQQGYFTVGRPGIDSVNLIGTGLGTGTIDGYVLSPTPFSQPIEGVIITAFNSVLSLTKRDTTDAMGYYFISNMGLNPITVTPSKIENAQNHIFSPTMTNVPLVNSTPVRVDFRDQSIYTVTGKIVFKGTSCSSPYRSIKMDGQTIALADTNGNYTFQSVPIGSHTFKPDTTGGHTFIPPSQTLYIGSNTALPNFEDEFTYTLSGHVTGGCGAVLANSVTLTVTCLNSCKGAVSISTNDSGYYSIDLPPGKYNVKPTTFYYQGVMIAFTTKLVDLRSHDAVQDFIYHSVPIIKISGFDTISTNQHGWIILKQFETYNIRVDVFEPYIGLSGDTTLCRVDTGFVTILDELSDRGLDTLNLADSTIVYALKAGLPNIAGGGPYGYKKRVWIQYVRGATSVSNEKWAYIVGERPRSTAFATTTPDIPLLILRDPPGDGSYSYFNETKEVSQAISFGMKSTNSGGTYLKKSLGADFELSAGFIFTFKTNVDVTLDMTTSLSASMTQNSVTENQVKFVTSETFKTGSGKNFVGHKADVFMGGAMNLLYGITDMLSIADTVVTVKQDIIIVPHGFATTYIFTEDWIKKTTIPSLYLIEDIVSAHRWESFLALNDSLKKRAVFKKNISYAGGSGYGYSESMTKTDTYTQQFDMVIDAKVAADVGITVNGIGAVGGVNVSTSYTTGKSQVNTKVNTTTSGFELYDGEALDGFTVDVKEDPVYGTPVFVTKSGQTKCPHEDNTTAREGTELFPKTNSQSNVPANSSASFTLYMNNTGSEKGDYELSVLNVTNATYGASIFAGGYSLASPIIYNLPVNTMTPVTIFITRPAGGQIYDFTGIKLRLSSQCETGPGMSDTATFDVHFTPPCSRVSISSPTINWVINQANNNILPVTVTDYDLNNPQLQEIGLQYSSNSGNTWTTLFSTFKDVISGPTIVYNWNVTGYSDGFYSLRAFSKCAGGIMNYTVGLDGVIDLHAPVAVSPLPAGGVLHTGDEISFTFNEALNPESVTVNTCKIVNPVNGVQVGASVAYLNGSNKIVFTIQPENNYFIENQYLTSMVTGVTDRYGNPLVGTASFTFLVDQGPLHWTPNSFPFSVPGPGNSAPFNFSSLLSNSSSSPVSYLLVKPGSIGSTTPSTGSLTAAGGSVTANFSTQAMSPGNPRYDTIYARTLGYPDEMVYVSFYTPTNLALSTNTNTLDVSATAGNSSFAINSNLSWKVSETATWLSATPLQGNSNKTIPLTYAENTSTSDRSAVITITSQGVLPEKTVTVTVTQTAPGVPVSVIVPAHTVASGIVECYKAQQTITAQNLVVESGGNVKLIAGTKITLQPGVHAKAGSAFHGWISATDLCGSAPSQLISGTDDQVSPQESGKEFFAQDKLFRVYPNPTTGEFTLELLKFDALSNITVNIYGMQGNKIQSAELPARKRYTFNLSDSKAGLYLIQVMNNGVTGVTRIVKQ